MPPRGADPSPAPAPDAPGRGGLLADIRGGARLKRVSSQEKRDRSAAAVPGGEPVAPPGGGSAPSGAGDAQGGLAGALGAALAARKSKVGGDSGEFYPTLREFVFVMGGG